MICAGVCRQPAVVAMKRGTAHIHCDGTLAVKPNNDDLNSNVVNSFTADHSWKKKRENHIRKLGISYSNTSF